MSTLTYVEEDDDGEWAWPKELSEMKDIEVLLRCTVCGDLFHAPVVLPCSHTFCSECVRKFFLTKGSSECCPECKQRCTSSQLLSNRSLERIVMAFKKMKPKLLFFLEKIDLVNAIEEMQGNNNTKSTRNKEKNSDTKEELKRIPLTTYNFMKDKDLKKLLESSNLRVNARNRDDMIQVHKEYVLLTNAQLDSCNPKTPAQIREEVARNFNARHKQKLKQKKQSATSGDNRNSIAISSEMQMNFERLKQQVTARKQETQQPSKAKTDSLDFKEPIENPSPIKIAQRNTSTSSHGGSNIYVWRHLHSVDSDRSFYINSLTNEIRLDRPPEYQSPKASAAQKRSHSSTTFATASPDSREELGSTSPTCSGSRIPSSGSKRSRNRIAPSSPSSFSSFDASKSCTTTTPTSSSVGRIRSLFSQEEIASFSRDKRRVELNSGSCQVEKTPSKSNIIELKEEDPPAKITDGWACPRCTLVNDTAVCEACGYKYRSICSSTSANKKRKQFQSKLAL